MRRPWRDTDYSRALEALGGLAEELERTHPAAAGSLREGIEETLTVIRLAIKGKLRRTLEGTNACESVIDTASGGRHRHGIYPRNRRERNDFSGEQPRC
jgi:hypothetical protein